MSKTRYASKRKLLSQDEDPPDKLQKLPEHFSSLPDEVLVYIFSFLSQVELYRTVCLVCKRWYRLALAPSLWLRISIGRKVPSKVAYKWLENSSFLRDLHVKKRNDVNVIISIIAKNCPNLQSISIDRCTGSDRRKPLNSHPLCKMLCRCKKLHTIQFDKVSVNSQKFFKLLTFRKTRTTTKWTYSGPVSIKQMNILLEGVLANNVEDSVISLGHIRKISLKELSVRKVDNSIDIPNTVHNIWEYINTELEQVDVDYVP